ncbi:outer membrane protein transport protein [Marinomonas sp. 5E14-1]|uniref:OmpP1/FadL family transporter n=1 Tax=Marinomonas sp. 5E14-1 TaxID=3153922 RepID=UPI0032678CAE
MTTSKTFFKANLVAASLVVASSAYSAGFALNDHSATASGTALAGVAASGVDISFSYWNPALFLNAAETTVYVSGAYVMPSMEATVTEAKNGTDLTATSANSSTDPVNNTLVPAIYFAKPLSDSTVTGISLNVPYGLSGDYGDEWAGRFHATETSIQDIALSFSLAHRLNEKFSVGASVQLHQADVVLASAIGNAALSEGDGRIEANATGYGYSLGALLEPVKGTRVGVGYRSEVDFDFEGDVTYANVDTLNSFGLSLLDVAVSDSLTFPSVFTISLDQELTEKLTLGLTAMRTGWDSIDGLRIDFDDDATTQSDSVLTFDFEYQWFYSAGLTYDYSDTLILRTGVAIDYSPVTDEYRSARTPDGDRTWLSFGGTYNVNDMASLTFAYTHVVIDDVSVSRDDTGEDVARGILEADYESSANLFSLAMNMSF